MAIAGYNALVTASTGSAASANFVTIQGIKSFTIGDSRDLLDVTDFADSNIHARLAALRDIKIDISGDYEGADAGWGKIQACYNAGLDVYVNVFTSAVATTAGFSYALQVANIDITGAVDGKVEVSASLMTNATGASVL